MRLFIAEKPSLAQAIAHGLGKGRKESGCFVMNGGQDVVTWCFGHILRQYSPDEYDEKYKKWSFDTLPIVPNSWKLKVAEKCGAQFKIIKKLISEADEIVNAGDPDREGQLLIDEVLGFVGNKKPVRRILLNALDDKSVKSALNDLQPNEKFAGLRDSALARSRADWLVGMNMTRAYSIRAQEAGYDGVVSVGRVQTPTMALVVRREEAIKNFKPVDYFVLQVSWHHPNGVFPTTWKPRKGFMGLDDEGRVVDKKIADTVLQKIITLGQMPGKARIEKIETTEKKEQQRLPYSLSALQIDAGRKFGLSPQQVLDTMQVLYERKLTTYPRSDCDYLPENQLNDAGAILNNLKKIADFDAAAGADLSIRSRAWNDKKISAHHAIIPTSVAPDFASLDDLQKKLYLLVARAYVAQFYPVHTYMATKVAINCSGEQFTANGKVIKDMGWKALYSDAEKKADPEDEDAPITIPAMKETDAVTYDDSRILAKQTKPPVRFTPATLLKAMKEIYKYVHDESLKPQLKECSGIGTEATRAGIIETLQERDYIRTEKKKLVPTDKAYLMCTVLPDSILYPDSTAIWEQSLDGIMQNVISIRDFFGEQEKRVVNFVAEAKSLQIKPAKNVPLCPTCGKPLRRHKGKKGFFWGCSGYPNCNATFPDKKGQPDLTAKKSESTGLTEKCPTCGKQLHQIKGKYGIFWSCEDRACKTMLSDCKNKPVMAKCPTCGKYLQRHQSKKGGYYWSCSDKSCKGFYPDKNGMPVCQ